MSLQCQLRKSLQKNCKKPSLVYSVMNQKMLVHHLTSCGVVRFYDTETRSVENKFWELYKVYNTMDPENVGKGAHWQKNISGKDEYA